MNRLNQVKRMTQMIQSTQSMDLIYQLNQLNQLNSIQYFVDLFWENHLFRWPFSEKTFDFFDLFWIFWINSIDSIKPVPKNLSTQSPILWKRIDSVTNQLTWEKTESTQSIFRKKMNRFKSIDSVELNRIQVCLLARKSALSAHYGGLQSSHGAPPASEGALLTSKGAPLYLHELTVS